MHSTVQRTHWCPQTLDPTHPTVTWQQEKLHTLTVRTRVKEQVGKLSDSRKKNKVHVETWQTAVNTVLMARNFSAVTFSASFPLLFLVTLQWKQSVCLNTRSNKMQNNLFRRPCCSHIPNVTHVNTTKSEERLPNSNTMCVSHLANG